MARFGKKTKTKEEIPTSALPDIIFMLLFFFMVTTVMRETDFLVEFVVPSASQIQKLEKKSLVSYIYIGKPKDAEKYGEENRIQVNDVIINSEEIPLFVYEEKAKLDEVERDKITMSLKMDKESKMGTLIDVQEQLREANALKVNYSSQPTSAD